MAKDFARKFYSSSAWLTARELYLKTQDYICERCGEPALIVHHVKHINKDNINDPNITLSFDNFMAVCQECHNQIHYGAEITREGLRFENGELIEVNNWGV